MGNTFDFGLNTGSYYGSGYSGYTGYSSYNNRVASSTNLNRVSRDIAQGYNQNMQVIDLYLKQGNINQAMAAYDSLFDNVKTTANGYGYELTDGQISSILNQAYQNATGNSFVNAVNEETHSPFVTGLIEGVPVVGWLFGQSHSNAEALAKTTGTKASTRDKLAEYAGAAIPGAAALGIAVAKGAKIGLLTGHPVVGALVGAAVGIVAAVIKGAIDNN
ncbi:MAG: hypothetical protein IJ877_05350 [Candidatus Gastranaerophilales bacterium]|nr:hypothetical protein [Candidatus Gastranaerophilales bacterium]